jgi:methanogenic corrinoid protein MtbC1
MSDDRAAPRLPPAVAGSPPADLGPLMTPELLAGLLADGDEELATWTLENALGELPRAGVYDGLVRDAMALVGRRWVEGTWGIAEEHVASGTLLRCLERVAPALGPERRLGPGAVLMAVSGERHSIGLVCVAHVLAEAGWSVVSLGADEPADDLARYVARVRPALVCVTASTADRADAVRETVDALRAIRDEPPALAIGGGIAADPAAVGDLGADWIGTSLADLVRYAAALRERLEADGRVVPPGDVF